MKRLKIFSTTLFCILTLASGWTCYAHESLEEKIERETVEKIMKLAKPLPEDKVFYRWQSKKQADQLIGTGHIDDTLYKFFQGNPTDSAGKGLYLAADPVTSAMFMRGYDGALIEVHAKAGTPYIDLDNPATLDRFKELRLRPGDIEHYSHAPVLVRYDDIHDWWVMKGREGMTFHSFNGQKFTTAELQALYTKLDFSPPAQQTFLNAIRPELAARIEKDASLIRFPVMANILPEEKALVLLEKQITAPGVANKFLADALQVLEVRNKNFDVLSPEIKSVFLKAANSSSDPALAIELLKSLSKVPATYPTCNELLHDILKKNNTPNKIKIEVLKNLYEINPPSQAMTDSQYSEILKALESLEETSKNLDTKESVMKGYLRFAAKRQSLEQGEINKLTQWLKSPKSAIRTLALKALDEQLAPIRQKLITPEIQENLMKVMTGSNAQAAEEVFTFLSEWEERVAFKGQYFTKSMIDRLLSHPNASVRARTVNGIAFHWISDRAENSSLLLDAKLLESALHDLEPKQAMAKQLILEMVYPSFNPVHPVDIAKAWPELNYLEQNRVRMRVSTMLHENQLPRGLKRRWAYILEHDAKSPNPLERALSEFTKFIKSNPELENEFPLPGKPTLPAPACPTSTAFFEQKLGTLYFKK